MSEIQEVLRDIERKLCLIQKQLQIAKELVREDKVPESAEEILDKTPFKALGLSVRAANAINDFETVRELIYCARSELVGRNRLGNKSLREIEDAIKERGLRFGMRLADPNRVVDLDQKLMVLDLPHNMIRAIDNALHRGEDEYVKKHTIRQLLSKHPANLRLALGADLNIISEELEKYGFKLGQERQKEGE